MAGPPRRSVGRGETRTPRSHQRSADARGRGLPRPEGEVARVFLPRPSNPPSRSFLERFRREEEGQGVVEYGLILGLMVLIGVATMSALGTNFTDFFTGVTTTIEDTLASVSS